jgi:hypothetical protein
MAVGMYGSVRIIADARDRPLRLTNKPLGGHQRTSSARFRVSAVPPKADINENRCHVR